MIAAWCQERLAHLDGLDRQGVSRGRRVQALRLTIRTARSKAAFIRALQVTGNRRQARVSVGWRPGTITGHRRQDPVFAALDARLAGADEAERLTGEVASQARSYIQDCETLAAIADRRIRGVPEPGDPVAAGEVDLAELLRQAAEVLDPDAADETRRRLARQLAGAAPEATRLQRVEAAALAVLSRGQARYDAEEIYAGDFVPTEVMTALREAAEGAPAQSGEAQSGVRDRGEIVPNGLEVCRVEADQAETCRPLTRVDVDEIDGIAAIGVPMGPTLVGRLCADWRRLTDEAERLRGELVRWRGKAMHAGAPGPAPRLDDIVIDEDGDDENAPPGTCPQCREAGGHHKLGCGLRGSPTVRLDAAMRSVP